MLNDAKTAVTESHVAGEYLGESVPATVLTIDSLVARPGPISPRESKRKRRPPLFDRRYADIIIFSLGLRRRNSILCNKSRVYKDPRILFLLEDPRAITVQFLKIFTVAG